MLGYLVVVILVAAVGIFGNILVLVTLVIDRKLRVLNNLFIANLAVADLFIAAIIHPFTAVGIIGGREQLFFQESGEITYLCEFLASFCIISCSASLFSIGAVAFNRYVYICHNRVYSKLYTHCTIPVMIIGIWIIGTMIDLPTYLQFGNHIFHARISTCFFNPLHPGYKVLFVVANFFPMALTVYCYIRIIALVYRRNQHLQKTIKQANQIGNHNTSAIKAADVRLLKAIAAMAILALIIYTPFAITLLADRGQISETVWRFSNGLMHSFSCINWLIYAVTNNRIRNGFTKIFRKCLCKQLCLTTPTGEMEMTADATGEGTSGGFSETAATSSGGVPGINYTYPVKLGAPIGEPIQEEYTFSEKVGARDNGDLHDEGYNGVTAIINYTYSDGESSEED